MAMQMEDSSPLVGDSPNPKLSAWTRRGLLMTGGLVFLGAVGLTVGAYEAMKLPEEKKGFDWTQVEFPGMSDVKEILEMVQEIYPDNGHSVFKELKGLDVDNSDPKNIKFKLKKSQYPNATMRSLQEGPATISYMKSLEFAMCGIDGYQSAITTGQIVTNIRTLTQVCESPYPQTPEQQDLCGGMVSLNIALWGFLACFIEDMVSMCGPTFDLNAGCAIDITGFLTNFALASSAAAGMKGNCFPPGGYKATTPAPDAAASPLIQARNVQADTIQAINDFVTKRSKEQEEQRRKANERLQVQWAVGAGARRLEGKEFHTLPVPNALKTQESLQSDVDYMNERAQETIKTVKERMENREDLDQDTIDTIQKVKTYQSNQEEKRWKAAACALDSQKAAARLAQFGVLIAMAEQDCSSQNFDAKGNQGKTKCAIDVTAAIASAGIAASLITISVINCPQSLEFTKETGDRLCAASIIDLVTASAYIGTSIASVQGTCGSLDKYDGVPSTHYGSALTVRR
ncbi:unnamed protein product [Effrenium voratum]|nr:unnamed protein product [Effrenium voratum]